MGTCIGHSDLVDFHYKGGFHQSLLAGPPTPHPKMAQLTGPPQNQPGNFLGFNGTGGGGGGRGLEKGGGGWMWIWI